MKQIKFLFIGLVLVFNLTVKSQTINMFHIKEFHHKVNLNPALNDTSVFSIGIPGISNVSTAFYNYSFDLIDFLETPTNLDNYLLEKNSFNLQNQLTIFSIGSKIADNLWFDFNWSLKTDFNLTLPQDLFKLAWYGNDEFIGDTADFSGFDFSLNSYLEYAFGFSYAINSQISVGGRFKFLNGLGNFGFEKFSSGLYTDPEDYNLTIFSDMAIQASAPLRLNFVDGTYVNDQGEVEDIEDLDENGSYYLNNYLLDNQNKGYAFDFGVAYRPIPKLELSASVVDLGKINWNSYVFQLSQKGEYTFTGIDANPYLDDDGNFEDELQEMADSLENIFTTIYGSYQKYSTNLFPKVYLGASYDILSWLNTSVLYQSKFYSEKTYHTYSFGANAYWKWVSASINYTYSKDLKRNLGFGLLFKAGAFQYYMLFDNVLGWRYDPDENIIWPKTARYYNFQLGFNFVFFGKSKDKVSEDVNDLIIY